MVAVDVGVDESDGHRLIAVAVRAVGQAFDKGPGLVVVEWSQNPTIGADPFSESVAVPTLDEWHGQDEVQVVLLEPAFGPHLDCVPEALGGYQSGTGSGPADQGVGSQRGPVDERLESRQVDPSLGHHGTNPVEDAVLGCVVGGEDLGREHPLTCLEHHVGERPPDVGTDAHAPGGHRVPAFSSRRRRARRRGRGSHWAA